MAAATLQELALRYPAICDTCQVLLPIGSEAAWHPVTGRIRCRACFVGDPVTPLTSEPLDRGTPGRSAEHLFGACGKRGAEGERVLGDLLEGNEDLRRTTLHDRSPVGVRWNIDHLVVAATGIFVIDAKCWSGRLDIVERPASGRVRVDGWDKTTSLVASLEQQVTAVQSALPPGDGSAPIRVRPVVCFVLARFGAFYECEIDGVLMTWPSALLQILREKGDLTLEDRVRLVGTLAGALPPA